MATPASSFKAMMREAQNAIAAWWERALAQSFQPENQERPLLAERVDSAVQALPLAAAAPPAAAVQPAAAAPPAVQAQPIAAAPPAVQRTARRTATKRKYLCEICGRRFSTRQNWKSHFFCLTEEEARAYAARANQTSGGNP